MSYHLPLDAHPNPTLEGSIGLAEMPDEPALEGADLICDPVVAGMVRGPLG
jgi:hypothetical protein